MNGTNVRKIGFLALDLAKWDKVAFEALVVTFFVDERPLRGAAGLADWRLCGRLSRLLKNGKLAGDRREALMLPPARGRLPFERIILLGLGHSADWDEGRYREDVAWIRQVVTRAGIRHYALQPPGRSTGMLSARRALELWLESQRAGDVEDVTILEAPGAQKETAEALRRHGKAG